MTNKSTIYYIKFAVITLVISSLGFSSCSSSKKSKDEVGFVGNKFHDLTAKFNGYFNANELYKASKLQLETSYQDNYNRVLNIYPYESVQNPQAVEEDMDKAVEKVIKVSSIHEVSKWVDDCYVLMGKAQYLKGDYESAQETFAYFVDDFNPKDPDSRVYVTIDRADDAKAHRKEVERERKIKQEERDKARKETEKKREEDKKARKKAKKKRGKKRSKKRTPKEVIEEAKEEVTEITTKIEGIVDSSNEIPLSEMDEDEEYLNSLNQEKKKKKKLTDNSYDKGFLKHPPAYYQGMLWLSKSYIKRDKWLDAKYYLDKIVEEGLASENITSEAHVVRADMLIKMKDYKAALQALDIAIVANKDKRLKARLAFIQGQIHQIRGNAAQASNSFDLVKEFRPSFEMELHAEMNQLRNSWAAGTTSSESAIKRLEKLAKESKNEPYKGAIYFTRAEILLANGNVDEALALFNQALQYSDGTNKTEIYHRLSTLFLSREEYVNAKSYFDSTLTLMPKKDERYPTVEKYANNLKSISENITIIRLQDSLLDLSQLSTEELEAFALSKAKEIVAAQQKSEDAAEKISVTTSVLSGNSRFFAYNPASVQKGRQDFNKRWGDRPLEDDWRRSNKSSSFNDIEDGLQEEQVAEIDYSAEINKILRGIPKDAQSQQDAKDRIEKAMFELGTGFRTYIEKFKKSNDALKSLLNRFPDTDNKVEAYYYLYLNYLDLVDSQQAESYKQKILTEFSDSPFAIYLRNPSDENALMTDEKKIQIYYQNTYEEFEKGNFQLVFNRLEKGREDFGQEHKMAAKYDLLRAMAIGNTAGQNEYINALRGVILKYNNTPEQTYAKEMLRFLRGDEEAFGNEASESDLSKFKVEDDKLHYIIFLLYGGDGNIVNELKNQLNKYNADQFPDLRLRSTSMYLNQEKKTHLVLLRRFNDADQAMEYYENFQKEQIKILYPSKFSYDIYAVNQLNYREIITSKSTNSYRLFFEQQYLNNKKEDK